MGSGAKSYMRKGFLIYEENFILFLISVQLISVPFNNLLTTDCNAVFLNLIYFTLKQFVMGELFSPWEFSRSSPVVFHGNFSTFYRPLSLSFLPVCLWEGFCGVTVG